MITDQDQNKIANYYDRLVDQYGYDPRACDASGAMPLKLRYEALAGVADLTGKSILEVGCGFGDLGIYFQQKYAGVQYLGIDVSRRMIEEGQRVHPNLSLQVGDILNMDEKEKFDIVVAQGIFYLLGNNAEMKMQRLIHKMFTLSKEALAFSTISSWAPIKSDNEFNVDPVSLLVWCRTLTPYLVLKHEYLPNDVTIYLYRR